jgi:predicted enzyme related to lactoylglutathione lyase
MDTGTINEVRPATVAGIGFVTAFVDDFSKALEFYTGTLGLENPQPMGANACYFTFRNDTGMYLVGGNPRRERSDSGARTTFAIEVASARELFDRLKDSVTPPLQTEPMRMNDDVIWFQVDDPAGNRIEIVGG